MTGIPCDTAPRWMSTVGSIQTLLCLVAGLGLSETE
jgi:hypothetical protein